VFGDGRLKGPKTLYVNSPNSINPLIPQFTPQSFAAADLVSSVETM
jgi:hypothetical protein